MQWKFIIASDCGNKIILGNDLLNHGEAVINLKTLSITWKDGSITPITITEENKQWEVHSLEEYYIGTNKSQFIKYKLVNNFTKEKSTEIQEVEIFNSGNKILRIKPNQEMLNIQLLSDKEINLIVNQENVEGQIQNLQWTHLKHKEEIKLKDLLMKYKEIFAENPKGPGFINDIRHKINTGEATPIKQRPHRISESEKEIIEKEIQEMLKNKVIKISESPWASPVVLVNKPDGSTRFCIDYRRLNTVTKKDVYPLPLIDDILTGIMGCKLYSSVDAASGYWQVPIEEVDREKSAFITHMGLYEWIGMPFGLCNAPDGQNCRKG